MTRSDRLSERWLRALPPGRLVWIGLRPARRAPVKVLENARALAGQGLEGDRRCQGRAGSARQVTLIQAEHLPVIAALLGKPEVRPEWLRRNLVVAGINLQGLRHRRFRIGDALFEGTANCPPCSRMEEALGPGGFAAMLGHGGICARILESGAFQLDDPVLPLDD
ncbi:MOSC domain-containing protein [Motiliproteus sp. SC1-56]|uniref:MOSC domain-containing protein n=1 Tax=Motiliproteus sp. SC1-56 TaxID=2799565 RepID=UPI001A8E1E3A|nr:MOSC domain-containing protein [Motiliproteus sp. SC1-56]